MVRVVSHAGVGAPPMLGPQPDGQLTQSVGRLTLGLESRLCAGKQLRARPAVEGC